MLRIEPGHSPTLSGALVAAHTVAGGAVVVSALTWPVTVLLVLAVGVSLIRALRRTVPTTRSLWGAVLDGDGHWWELGEAGPRYTHLSPDTYIHPALVILRFEGTGGGRRSLLVPRDTVDPETFRRLRVTLELSRPAPATLWTLLRRWLAGDRQNRV